MLSFRTVTQRSISSLRAYYRGCSCGLCEYSAGVKLMWRGYFHPEYAETNGCLIVKNTIHGATVFDYPVARPGGDEDAALREIETFCADGGIPLAFAAVPEEKAAALIARYPRVRVDNVRAWRDYVYDAEDLREFAGRRYSGQRNHVNKFKKNYPDASFRELGKGDGALVEAFWRDYEAEFGKTSESAANELKLAQKMLRLAPSPHFCAGGIEQDGKLLSLSLAERCGETLIIHVEKALYHCEGVYPATVQAFARRFAVDGVRYINREDDASDRGLRTSKLQYQPVRLGAKYRVRVENELYDLREIPRLKTARLTLSALTERDAAAYNALCLDDARNRWWGYDYRSDWKDEPLEAYFLAVAREDFAAHRAVNFAVRLNGRCIGEAVLYRFDGRGGAELGCRIAPEYAGNGYGTEAFAAAADWALYDLKLSHVVAKCFRENAASYRMLSSCMRRVGKDETYFYFDKEV